MISKQELARLQTQVRAANTLVAELNSLVRRSVSTRFSRSTKAALMRYQHTGFGPTPGQIQWEPSSDHPHVRFEPQQETRAGSEGVHMHRVEPFDKEREDAADRNAS